MGEANSKLIPVFIFPFLAEVFAQLTFAGVVLGFIQNRARNFGGHEFLLHEIAFVGVGVFVTISVAKVFHQFRGGVAKVQGH